MILNYKALCLYLWRTRNECYTFLLDLYLLRVHCTVYNIAVWIHHIHIHWFSAELDSVLCFKGSRYIFNYSSNMFAMQQTVYFAFLLYHQAVYWLFSFEYWKNGIAYEIFCWWRAMMKLCWFKKCRWWMFMKNGCIWRVSQYRNDVLRPF